MVTRVAILDDYQKVAERSADWSVLPKGVEVTFFHDHLDDPDRLVARLAPFEVIGIMRERTPFPGALLERLPNLRCLITTGPRNASIDVAAAQRLGITVCGTRSSGHATAELAMALILALARGLLAETASMRAGGWQVGLGRDLAGATLGVVGLGRLGSRLARIGQAFGMTTIAWSQNLTEAAAAEHGVRRVHKADLFRHADFVSVHLQLSDAHPRPDRCRRARADAAEMPASSTPRAARSSTRTRWWTPSRPAASPAQRSTSTIASRCRRTTGCGASPTFC